jgi:hypothetical protein
LELAEEKRYKLEDDVFFYKVTFLHLEPGLPDILLLAKEQTVLRRRHGNYRHNTNGVKPEAERRISGKKRR